MICKDEVPPILRWYYNIKLEDLGTSMDTSILTGDITAHTDWIVIMLSQVNLRFKRRG